jgi:protein-L-isoaspartate(D-aspartate) O-methyltransferase
MSSVALRSSGDTTDARASNTLDSAALLNLAGVQDLPLARAYLGEQLRAFGTSTDVVRAMTTVPRHAFAPAERWRAAYLDLDLWTGATWLTRPSTIARMLDALQLCPGLRVLEIGTGTGYQAALMATLNLNVTTVDISQSCAESARKRLERFGAKSVRVLSSDGFDLPSSIGLFDVVSLNAAVPRLPHGLISLTDGEHGAVVAPVRICDGTQRLLRYSIRKGRTTTLDLGICAFDPILTGKVR